MTSGAPGRQMGGAEWGMLGLLSLVWGGSFFFYKVLVQALPPFTVVLGRMTIAALALNLWLLARPEVMRSSLKAKHEKGRALFSTPATISPAQSLGSSLSLIHI